MILATALAPGGFASTVGAPAGARAARRRVTIPSPPSPPRFRMKGFGAGARRAFSRSMSTIVPTLRSNDKQGSTTA